MPLVNPITVRIPELPAQVPDPTSADYLAYWNAADNKTRKLSITQLISLVLTGGPTALVPVVVSGGNVYGVVSAADALTGNIVSRPDLAGKTFDLYLDSVIKVPQTDPPNALAQFEVLSGGGFKLLGDVVHEGQPYKLEMHGSTVGGGGGVTALTSLFAGKKVVNTNYLLDIVTGGADLNKIVQLRSGATQITLTLPSVLDVPDNLPILIEADITNDVENKITTTGGQFFYFNNTSKTYLQVRPGEVVWLFKDVDGYYVINDFGNNYKSAGKPYPTFKVEEGEILCDGTEYIRADYKRMWDKVSGYGASLVDEATWSLASAVVGSRTVLRPNRGKWSTGNGSTTFRVPDLMGMTLRGLLSGSDAERHTNVAGNYQRHEYESHDHPNSQVWNETGGGHLASGGNSNEGGITDRTGFSGGAETRMDNVGIYWVVKA